MCTGNGRGDDTPPGAATDDRGCPAALQVYLRAVADALARRCIGAAVVVGPATEPGRALTGRLELDRATARPDLSRGPVTAVWHEELGWWAELTAGPGSGPARRYLHAGAPADIVPYPTLVADFLAGLARGEDLGSITPAVPRRPPPAGADEPHPLLTRSTGANPASDRVSSDRAGAWDRMARRRGRAPTGRRP